MIVSPEDNSITSRLREAALAFGTSGSIGAVIGSLNACASMAMGLCFVYGFFSRRKKDKLKALRAQSLAAEAFEEDHSHDCDFEAATCTYPH